MDDATTSTIDPTCRASNTAADNGEAPAEQGAFRHGYWTPDGTSLLATTDKDKLETYIVPPDLLTSSTPHNLTPYSAWQASSSILASAAYPFFDLSNPSTTLVLCSVRDQPIRLKNVLDFESGTVASYPGVDELTERIYPQFSLAFTSDGTHFVAGSDTLLSTYNINRSGEGPVEKIHTIPSKRDKRIGGGVGMKGVISTLSISAEGILAAGTFTKKIGLYGNEGRGDTIAIIDVNYSGDTITDSDIEGNGITQLAWSPCGRYLYVAMRQSDGVLIYDVRVTGKMVAWLKQRNARTNQRLAIDVVPTAEGHEIWAGGMDGVVRVWKNPGEKEGAIDPWFEWNAHSDPVVSSVVHRSGSVVASFSAPDREVVKRQSASEDSASEDSESESGDSANGDSEESFGSTDQQQPNPFGGSVKIWSL